MQLTDHTGNTGNYFDQPRRIISLVPSQTELLAYLGLDDRVVGITKFCIHPEHWFSTKMKVGGTKKINREKIMQLLPDLVIANKEENDKEQIEWLRNICPVFVTDVKTLENAHSMIAEIGLVTGTGENATQLISELDIKFAGMAIPRKRKTCAYLIWNEPLMVAGGDTFINDMLQRSGFDNLFAKNQISRYPEVSIEMLQQARPEVVMLSSEPYPFSARQLQHFQSQLPHSIVLHADGEMFSWYGSRLLQFDAQPIQRLLGMC
jgi:ABC-type Fe3+-hydroxamate transport system substrate-binding protein